ncbi:hypothetical protein [Amycolatopsis cihanbeyliensis]|uniref:Secreted protein n=1 Tax=Amycolatopsis cihanbeyliensis TaxID=1128664 RepID=A0A542DQX5_AMYCI|nr:hypothetical protein [Amycolatopsis cihanbeyliensis]TQJ05467.1 hypothetical protein FB471_5300 [Amycolatopsis cihanbeyliensis]
MFKKLFLRSFLAATATLSMAFVGPVAQAEVAAEGHAITAAEIEAVAQQQAAPPPGGWQTPSNRSYYLLSSCRPYASAIRQGAAAWAGLTEGGGTPVECRNSYIRDCGGGSRVVGCNWGRGQRIALYMGGVNDDALLAAHEFGHDWYGHSSYRCAGWSSPSHVMAPSICNGPTLTNDAQLAHHSG